MMNTVDEHIDTNDIDTDDIDTDEHIDTDDEFTDSAEKQRFEYYLNNCERVDEESSEDRSNEGLTVTALTVDALMTNAQIMSATPICNCIKRIVADGSERGCGECDEHWDMPCLVDFDVDEVDDDIPELIAIEDLIGINHT